MEDLFPLKALISATVFSLLGIIVLAIAFWVFDKLTPGELWHHIIEEKNVAIAITAAAMIIAMGTIIAAAIHG